MRKKNHDKRPQRSAGYDHRATGSDFYNSSHAERPLYQERGGGQSERVNKTARHKAVTGRRKEDPDIRDKMALLGILKSVIIMLFLIIVIFMIYKGAQIYEQKLTMENEPPPEISAVMQEFAMGEDFDITNQDQDAFKQQIATWKYTEQLVNTADALVSRNNYDGAIELCEQVLQLDPLHLGAYGRLGQLYFDKGLHTEAINAYSRALSIDPSQQEFQMALIKVLDTIGDSDAVIAAAQWYQEVNVYDQEVQRAIANSYFREENFEEAATAYARFLKDNPEDAEVLDRLAVSHLQLEQYDEALEVLKELRIINHRDPLCYQRIAICYAQLGKGVETVETLSISAHLFGPNVVAAWMQDPIMSSINDDETYSLFVKRIGGDSFREYLNRIAQVMNLDVTQEIDPQLSTALEESELQDLLQQDD